MTGLLVHGGMSDAMRVGGKALVATHLTFFAIAASGKMKLRVALDGALLREDAYFATHFFEHAPNHHVLTVSYHDHRSFGWSDTSTPIVIEPEQITHVLFIPGTVLPSTLHVLGTWPRKQPLGAHVIVPGADGKTYPARAIRDVEGHTLVELTNGLQRWYHDSLVHLAT